MVERINWMADRSEKGLHQSGGIMVNYVYRLTKTSLSVFFSPNHFINEKGGPASFIEWMRPTIISSMKTINCELYTFKLLL